MKKHIHIFGASGSGTTTLATALCNKSGFTHIDTDDYFWLPTNPPYTDKRPIKERQQLMLNAFTQNESWICSGSLCGWGDMFIELFDLVIFIYTPQDIRIERLNERQYKKFGEAIKEGGDMYKSNLDFIEWAKNYDTFDEENRSLKMHNNWLKKINCPALKLQGENVLNYNINITLNEIYK